eukprot:CAMPEP_0201492800 /NCGR_PEP_ID=MMETSP0151_2-20130828/34790_1 /ASSEMBLY_ACC=CAM_ASM_000257 /TAXON_ID=200890 /ORGANISM="Paramoeba atlantica, Strain 621/1 / CCAP 1560/9" /LENGTH=605 /DNA_ID=CAMNT_0047879823 /DNA_START=73 /DNA_END=1890 /DNA_ORIENTATION=-
MAASYSSSSLSSQIPVYIQKKEDSSFQKYIVCVECEDVPAVVECLSCKDVFCGLCFEWVHKKGKRASHQTKEVQNVPEELRSESKVANKLKSELVIEPAPSLDGGSDIAGTTAHFKRLLEKEREEEEERVSYDIFGGDSELATFKHRCQAIPLRLTDEERVLLHILEGALDISEYTDNVDVSSNMFGWGWRMYESGSSSKRYKIEKEQNEFFSFLHGLYVCSNLRSGKKLIEEREFQDNARFLSRICEIGRRYKIMNPDKMRTTYGKLMYILMDTTLDGVLDYSIITDILTVDTIFSQVPEIYSDPLLLEATKITKTPEQAAKKAESKALIIEKYQHQSNLEENAIERCLDSIGDSNNYIVCNRDPVNRMIEYLTSLFSPNTPSDMISNLEIHYGSGGSKLSHSHSTQFEFVHQSLLLWREIQNEMYRLWINADADLLSTNSYRLSNTGQGLQRIQAAPNVARCMSAILHRVQKYISHGWVGLSVVHLGDRDVPNALTFIDKYTQVPRILGPFVQMMEQMQLIAKENVEIKRWLDDSFDGVVFVMKRILRDFFRHGFDGSGDDGGSCVDGRLTSSWNWCSRLEKKEYCPVFMLTGFEGFNGSFRK